MKLADFDYQIPRERIAQQPLEQREASKLLVLDRNDLSITEKTFSDLPGLLRPGDLLVVNHTVVRPMRLRARKSTGAKMEITFTGRTGDGLWECMIKGRGVGPGQSIELEGGITAEVVGQSGSVRDGVSDGAPLWKARIEGGDLEELMKMSGLPPLPPYIRRGPDDDPEPDRERYQTVYALEGTAAAAPTAGLHFSRPLIGRLREKGVELAGLRLDVSWGTFAPVRVDDIEDHVMHPERFELSAHTAEAVNRRRAAGGRVVAVGTTSVRTLEHCADDSGLVRPAQGETSLYIRPGYRFKTVDAMITNFHMPRSTLLVLVAAFAGLEFTLRAYAVAVERGFRMLSYGDAMLIL